MRRARLVLAFAVAACAASGRDAYAQQACDPLPRGVAGWGTGDDTATDLTLNANHAQLMNGATFGSDGAFPAPGHGFGYLYRGRNTCGTGTYGFGTRGTERIGATCN